MYSHEAMCLNFNLGCDIVDLDGRPLLTPFQVEATVVARNQDYPRCGADDVDLNASKHQLHIVT